MNVLVVGGSSSVGKQVLTMLAGGDGRRIGTHSKGPLPAGVDYVPLVLDLADATTFEAFVAQVKAVTPTLDAVVMLSSVLPGKSLLEYSEAEMDLVTTVNFTSQAKLIKLLMPMVVERGNFVMMSSISGINGSYDPIYAGAKAGIIALTKSLAAWHGKRYRFSCICPRLIANSTMFEAMAPERREFHKKQSSTGELLSIEQVSGVIVDLLRKPWSALNGLIFELSAG